ncbi:flagellin lysine-N-methylase [Erwinia sp. S63]|uniref:flagellin lysine-N-methylase n=1 Tax=Erwinia sp. S63 TaxID=2769341 RepID=UPI00190D88FF|nr:flagellin lysine-N-methylase [Erwinia sp. S63]MBK0094737.1 flagellin lysine-N-methylase [Erwinia sp. S63]
MKEITVVEPVFYNEFKCIGSECKDHCCKGWNITLDKPTVNRYLKSNEIEIRSIAVENIITTKSSYSNWGKMKLSNRGRCAFMDEERLCKIHKLLGEAALSPTCATYPRIQNLSKFEIRQSLTLSCPEAAKQLLTRSDAMLFNEKKMLQAQALDAADVNQISRFINLMCTNIMIASGVNLEEGFYGIALLFIYLDKVKDDQNAHHKIEGYFVNIMQAIQTGELKTSISNINPDRQLQSALLLRLQGYLATKQGTRGWTTLQHYANKLIYIQSESLKNGEVDGSMPRLSDIWQKKVMPWLAEYPYLLNNYIQYRMYNDSFPSNSEISNLSNLYLMVSEWFLIKSLISSCVELVGEIQTEDFINIIYSYHAVTKHDTRSSIAFLNEIEKTKVNDDISLIYLLQ